MMSNGAQMSTPMRAPAWVSTRRLFEQKLLELPNCTNLSHVKQVHAQIIKQNLHTDLYVAPKLISAFSLSHHMKLAVSVFNQVPTPNVYLYNTLIRAHVHASQPSMAFASLFQMQQNGLFPDNFTYPFLLKACNAEPWLPVIQTIHGSLHKLGLFGDLFVPNSLIDSYSKCGVSGILSAMRLFRSMDKKDIVSWNTMIGGLVRTGDLRGARKLFDEMPVRDSISWNTVLDAYVKAGEMDEAYELFQIMPERNVVSWSTMVFGYSKAGDIHMARMLFDKMPVRNLVPWTIVISGYAQMGLAQEAVKLYDLMEKDGLVLDSGAAISILAACGESGLLCLGNRVHASVISARLKCHIEVCNALVYMYAKCGMVKKAYEVFQQMANTDLVSWNCMLQGLAVNGHGKIALQFFSRMKKEGFKPDKFTLVAVLCACTHAGFIDEGLGYFDNMEREYGIAPEIEHYGCVVDLLGRAGLLRDAFRLVESMPMKPNAVIWGTLLGACRMHNEVDLAKKVKDHMAESDLSEHGNGSMLSNIFAAAGDWVNVANVRLEMKSAGIQKPSGASFIEVEDEVHEFTVLDKSHPESDKVYETIDALIQELRLIADAAIDNQLMQLMH
ncbi:Pentatricopeptide repeat-containing protein At3g29230 [Linum grandiflorum]